MEKPPDTATCPPRSSSSFASRTSHPSSPKPPSSSFPDVNIDDLVRLKIFHIDDAFIAKAKQLGLNPLTVDKLVKLRISGLIEDEASDRHDPRRSRRPSASNSAASRELDREKQRDQQQKEKDKAEKDKDKVKDK